MSRLLAKLRRVGRFIAIYGAGRTYYKVAGRLRLPVPRLSLRSTAKDVGVIGCGQFAYATIAYFLRRRFGQRILACFDIDPGKAASFAGAHHVPVVARSFEEVLGTRGLKYVYIASNHASHARYAAAALSANLDVYVEKPIAVTRAQLLGLASARARSKGRLCVGYNRPFSAAVRELRGMLPSGAIGGLTLQCFVSGHSLATDHWYRLPAEGTRICGNVGHWLDLAIHVVAWRGLPRRIQIRMSSADAAEPDDNVAITLTTERHDLCSIVMTSRCEPFEGIQETINLQWGDVICKIDDFRSMRLWRNERYMRRRYWPKDVGHMRAIYQPFDPPSRQWDEVVVSTLLILRIAEMVRSRESASEFVVDEEMRKFASDVESGAVDNVRMVEE